MCSSDLGTDHELGGSDTAACGEWDFIRRLSGGEGIPEVKFVQPHSWEFVCFADLQIHMQFEEK